MRGYCKACTCRTQEERPEYKEYPQRIIEKGADLTYTLTAQIHVPRKARFVHVANVTSLSIDFAVLQLMRVACSVPE
eukprot:scaffold12960_cov28-Tisochrysis_lutea.AAC.2